jgi:hypothetical protein
MITVLNPFAGPRLRVAHDFTPSTAAGRLRAADVRACASLEWYEACAAQPDSSARWRGWVEESRRGSDDAAAYALELRAVAADRPAPPARLHAELKPRAATSARRHATTSVLVGHALARSGDQRTAPWASRSLSWRATALAETSSHAMARRHSVGQ